MTQLFASQPVRDTDIFSRIETAGETTKLLLVLFGTLLLTLSAKVQIPFWPVPMTMQPFVVLLIGMTYGARLGGAAILVYLCEGALGLPVFAGTPERGLGLVYLAGPTGGYLAGFLLAAVLVGWMGERGWRRSAWRVAAATGIGHVTILAAGMVWLASLIGWAKAWQFGVAPFLPSTVVNAALGVATVQLLSRVSIRRRADD